MCGRNQRRDVVMFYFDVKVQNRCYFVGAVLIELWIILLLINTARYSRKDML